MSDSGWIMLGVGLFVSIGGATEMIWAYCRWGRGNRDH